MFKRFILIFIFFLLPLQLLSNEIKFEKFYFLPHIEKIYDNNYSKLAKSFELACIKAYKNDSTEINIQKYTKKSDYIKDYDIEESFLGHSGHYRLEYYMKDEEGKKKSIFTISAENGEILFFSYKGKQLALIKGHYTYEVFQIFKNTTTKKIFSIQIYKKELSTNLVMSHAFLKTYSNMIRGTGSRGKKAFTRAILRPWSVANTSKYINENWLFNYNSQSASFIEYWSLLDNLNRRKYQTLEHNIVSARYELEKFYIDKYSLKKKDAKKLSFKNIHAVMGEFLSIVYDFHKDEQWMNTKKDISNGKSIFWNDFNKSIQNDKFTYFDDETTQKQVGSLSMDSLSNFKSFLEFDKSVEEVTLFNKTLLMYASHLNNYDAAKLLLDNNVSISAITSKDRYSYKYNYLNRLNRSALTYAVENASIELIKLLIDSGADIDIKDSNDNNLSYYLEKNPRFTDSDKKLTIPNLIRKYEDRGEMFQPSFDCIKAKTKNEQQICSNKTIAIYDRELGRAYKQLKEASDNPYHITNQKSWFKERNSKCHIKNKEKNGVCLKQMIRSRTRYLDNLSAQYKGLK